MHEYAIVKELVKNLTEISKQKNIEKISEIYLELGEFSGYTKESIEYYFNSLKESNQLLFKSRLIFSKSTGHDLLIKKITEKTMYKFFTIEPLITYFLDKISEVKRIKELYIRFTN